jgi:hypothetical protein
MPKKIDIPTTTIEEMCNLFRNGSSISDIMSKYALSRNKITKTLRDHLKEDYQECARNILASCATKAAPKLRGRNCQRTPEWNAKIAAANKGKKRSEETKRKISEGVRTRFERGTWTKEQYDIAMQKATVTKRKNGYYNVHAQRHSEWMIKNAPMRGKTMSEDSKRKMRDAKHNYFKNQGIASQLGLKRTEEQKNTISAHTTLMWKTGIFNYGKNGNHWRSKLEISIYEKFLERCPDAKHSHSIITTSRTYVFDIYISSLNLLIEVNGDYWHLNPTKYKHDYIDETRNVIAAGVWQADLTKREEAIKQGFIVTTIWESDITSLGIDCVVDRILNSTGPWQ